MPRTLFKFGVDPADPTAKASTPIPIITNAQIQIAWSSWCDLIYTTLNRDLTNSITYLGTSLNASQQLDFPSHPWIASSSNMRQPLLNPKEYLRFFGNVMQDGVRGYLTSNSITIFGTPADKAEKGHAYCDVDSCQISDTLQHRVTEVSICSDNSLLVAHRPTSVQELAGGESEFEPQSCLMHENTSSPQSDRAWIRPHTISCIESLQQLRDYCVTETLLESLAQLVPNQLVVNATSATALDENGRVYTRTNDPRYPACLGRPYTSTSTFEPVPYLSETRIVRIASGGYITAAISEEGELFLWGQANPGSEGEFGVLRGRFYEADTAMKDSAIWSEHVQDENVKCLSIHIGGREASAYDVAVGFGHILVAAKNDCGQCAVFAAGCGDEGQLGLGRTSSFLSEFEEVVALKKRHVTQMAAAGWSSFVIVDEQ